MLRQRAASWVPVGLALGALVALIWINGRLGAGIRAAGFHTKNDVGQDIIGLAHKSDSELFGSSVHEFFHALKHRGD